MRSFLKKVFGDSSKRELEELRLIADDVNNLESEFEALSDDEVRSAFEDLGARHRAGEELDDLMPESFALTREAAKRTLGMRPFDVQLMGAADGYISVEVMNSTGETRVKNITVSDSKVTRMPMVVSTDTDVMRSRMTGTAFSMKTVLRLPFLLSIISRIL